MNTCTLPKNPSTQHDSRHRCAGHMSRALACTSKAAGFVVGLFSRRVRITSPGQALSGFQITPEDADLLHRISAPNSAVGKPTLRAGPAIRRR
jgi:hypothetical protein